MKSLALLAGRAGSRALVFSSLALIAAVIILFGLPLDMALAQTATTAPAPVGGDMLGGIVSLWGPLLGVIAALVVFFNALAHVIPNSTTNGVLKVLLMVSRVLGLKVPDVQ